MEWVGTWSRNVRRKMMGKIILGGGACEENTENGIIGKKEYSQFVPVLVGQTYTI